MRRRRHIHALFQAAQARLDAATAELEQQTGETTALQVRCISAACHTSVPGLTHAVCCTQARLDATTAELEQQIQQKEEAAEAAAAAAEAKAQAEAAASLELCLNCVEYRER